MANISESVKNWMKEIENDEFCETTPVELGCICYATFRYIWDNEKTNMAEFFGEEYRSLNRSMANIYSQVDRIKNFKSSENNAKIKYDAEKIKELRLQGLSAKEICEKLGYPADKARSLTSNKGWVEAAEILKSRENAENTDSVQKIQKNTDSVQKSVQIEQTENVQKNTESVQKQTDNTDSVQNFGGFNF